VFTFYLTDKCCLWFARLHYLTSSFSRHCLC